MRVILPQFYQGMIPQKWAMNDEEKLLQQRNVAYVAMTRAMHQLTIVYNGCGSTFIEEMDSSLYTARTFETAVEMELKNPTPMYTKRIMPEEADNQSTETRRKRWSF